MLLQRGGELPLILLLEEVASLMIVASSIMVEVLLLLLMDLPIFFFVVWQLVFGKDRARALFIILIHCDDEEDFQTGRKTSKRRLAPLCHFRNCLSTFFEVRVERKPDRFSPSVVSSRSSSALCATLAPPWGSNKST